MPADTGTYHCIAISSKGGKATSNKAKLIVGMYIKADQSMDIEVEWLVVSI